MKIFPQTPSTAILLDDLRPESTDQRITDACEMDIEFLRDNLASFQVRTCPACQSENFRFFCEKTTFTFVQCVGCLSILMNPAPDQHLLNSFYSRSENYKVWGSYVYPITQESRWESLHKSRSERIQQAITDFMASEGESLLQPLRYLEIGAGTGDTAARFQSDSEAGQVEISVVEVNPDMLEILSKRSIPTVSDFQEVPDCSYHVVAAFEVLEHMLDPVSALQIAMAKLVPGGIFVFSTPNALSLEVQILRAKSTTLDHEHITVLSLVGLAMSAKAAGFLVRKIEAAGSLDIDLITKASDMSREHGIFLPNLKWGAQKDVSLGNLSSSSFGVFQKPF